MSKVIKDEVEFKFIGENMRGGFQSIEDALKYVKTKLPANGKSWKIEEVHTKVIEHEFESERKAIDNKEITKRIIDYFIEHATVDNVKTTEHLQYFMNPEHRDFRFSHQLYSFLCIQHYLGYTKEQYWELYNDLMSKNNDHSDYRVSQGICWLAIANKFNLSKDDIIKITLAEGWKDYEEYSEKHKNASKEIIYWLNDLNYVDGYENDSWKISYPNVKEKPNIWKWCTDQEFLDTYKERLKQIPIEDFEWRYNIGDYKPCHNYKLSLKPEKDISYDDYTIHMFNRLPGIMFRNNDIYITHDDYYGRNVNLRKSSVIDVNEDLYNYCIKNLK